MFDQREHFAKADQQVSELKQRIARQRNVIERTKETRHSTAAAELILQALESSLRAFEKYRQVIFDRQEAKQRDAIAIKEAPLKNAPAVKRAACSKTASSLDASCSYRRPGRQTGNGCGRAGTAPRASDERPTATS
jgi:hypothetical protein